MICFNVFCRDDPGDCGVKSNVASHMIARSGKEKTGAEHKKLGD